MFVESKDRKWVVAIVVVLALIAVLIVGAKIALSEEHTGTITVTDKAIGSYGTHYVQDAFGGRWWVRDPFLYNTLTIGETYEITYTATLSESGTSVGVLEGKIVAATPHTLEMVEE